MDILTVGQVCTGIVSLTALAFVSGGMNAIYQLERLPLMAAILIHGSVLYISYLVIWAVIYAVTRRSTDQINALLKQNRQP